MRELLNILEKTKLEKNGPVVVSLVGGGGKTTLLYALGRCLSEAGAKVLLTTSTMLFYPEDDQEKRLEKILIGLDPFKKYVHSAHPSGESEGKRKPVLMGDYITEAGEKKIKGFEKDEMEKLEAEGLFKSFDYIIIEADGAKKCPIKAPGVNEPVVISTTDIVVGLIGMDCLGLKLNKDKVHRLEELCSILKKNEGNAIEEEDIKTLVLSDVGLFKNTPSHGKTVFILNKAEGVENIEKAEKIIHNIRAEKEGAKIHYYFAASLEQEVIYKYFPLKIAKVVFAAGKAKRMGAQKLLLDLNGTPILEKVLQTVEETDFTEKTDCMKKTELMTQNDFERKPNRFRGVISETVLVYSDDRVKDLGEKYNIKLLIKNPDPERGMSSSLKLAVSGIAKDVEGYMFFMGDQPFVKKETIENIVELWLKDTTRIVVPYYSGKRGNPTLFPSELYEKLMKVEGDQGGRELIKSNLDKVVFMEVDNPLEGLDIDDPATYEELKGAKK